MERSDAAASACVSRSPSCRWRSAFFRAGLRPWRHEVGAQGMDCRSAVRSSSTCSPGSRERAGLWANAGWQGPCWREARAHARRAGKTSRANAGGQRPRRRQGSTLDGLAEGVEGQRWRARAALASRANQTRRRHRAPHVRCAPRGSRRRCRRISRGEAVPSHAPAPQDVPRPARWRSTGGNLSVCPAFAVPASARGATAALRRAPGSSPGPSAAGRDGSAGLPRRRRSRERAQVAGAGGTRQAWLRVEALEVTRDTRGREGPRGMWMWSGVRVVRADASCAPRGGSAQRWSALAACDQGWCWPLAMAPRCRDARERRGVTDRPRSRAAVHAV